MMVLVISAPETDHRPLCARQKTVTLASVMEWAVSGLLGLMAPRNDQGPGQENLLTWAFAMERVTGIEPALSAWEVSSTYRRSPAMSMTWALSENYP
jgi:hypothetical protein